jgi:transposase
LKGKHLGVDSTTVEANAAMRKLRHRMTGDTYWQYVKKLAAKSGVDPEDPDAVRRFDTTRPNKKMSNDDWEHPHDPDARIGQTKEKSTKMIYQQEHTVDMETGAIIDVQVRHADQGEAAGLAERVQDAERQMNHAIGLPISNATAETVTADKGYHKLEEITTLKKKGYGTVIPEMKRTRDMEAMSAAQRRAYKANAKAVRSAKGKALLRKRGEKIERSFAHVMNAGAMRRTTLRGLDKNRKRGLIGGIAANLCLLMRTLCGVGTVRQYLALPAGAWA